MEPNSLASALFPALMSAGREIMRHYRNKISIESKDDGSPVTAADRIAEDILLATLAEIAPGVPVIAEESASRGILPPPSGAFFLVDPLDGTKEFATGRPEFTVNVAFVEAAVPRFGAIYAPAMSRLYWTAGKSNGFFAEVEADRHVSLENLNPRRLETRRAADTPLTIVASRSHGSGELESWLGSLEVGARTNIGSSLKFCLVAEGAADLYPRFGPTKEWDTAAGHAIVTAAGGAVTRSDGEPFLYGKAGENYLNPNFVVWRSAAMADDYFSSSRAMRVPS